MLYNFRKNLYVGQSVQVKTLGGNYYLEHAQETIRTHWRVPFEKTIFEKFESK
mgnify:CR=1 FL=1